MNEFEHEHTAAQRDEAVRGDRSDADPAPWNATLGEKPLEAEMRSGKTDVFPPDVGGTTDIGGGPEDQHVLEEEMNR